jgi:putative membrane protein
MRAVFAPAFHNEASALDRRRPDRSRLRLHQAILQPSKSRAASSRINSNLMGKSAWAATSQLLTPEGCAIRRAGEVEMDTPIKAKPAADLRDYLAEERTFLAWIRTGITLMGFGFVVARFGIFLEQLHLPQQFSAAQPHEFSPWFGAALITTGALVNLFSARRFMRLAGEVDRNQFADRLLSRQGVFMASFLALVGIAMTIYLIVFLVQQPDAAFARIVIGK